MRLKEYSDFEEKSKRFEKHIVIDSLELLEKFLNKVPELNKSNKVFRGVGDSKYMIYTSAQRTWITQELKYRFESFESYLKQIVSSFLSTNPVIAKFFEKIEIPPKEIPVLSYLQHYGAPTPLIDFSHNLNVALYFAVDGLRHNPGNEIDNYFSVYILDEINEVSFQQKIKEEMEVLLKIDPKDILKRMPKSDQENEIRSLESIKKMFVKMEKSIKERLLDLKNFPKAAPELISASEINDINYFTHSNLNILNQEGIFVLNTLAYTPLEEAFDIWKLLFLIKDKEKEDLISSDEGEYNLSNSFDFLIEQRKKPIKNSLTCINIHKSFKEYVQNHLVNNGVTEGYIYPNVNSMIKNSIKNMLKYRVGKGEFHP